MLELSSNALVGVYLLPTLIGFLIVSPWGSSFTSSLVDRFPSLKTARGQLLSGLQLISLAGFAVSTQTLWISSKISEGGSFCSSTSTFSCDDLLGNSELNVDPVLGLSWGLIGMAAFALLLFIVLVLKQEHNHPLSERFVSMGLLTTGIGILIIGLLVSYEFQEEKICLYCTTAHIANIAAFVGFFRLRRLHENRDEWNK
ncbi:MAG: hypothetical protein CMA45_03365 [Euryarchaeota archaeon]|nr:hypothetical protein [Euryarchaeota archaeon]